MYSRRAKVEEKKNIKKAYLYVFLSVVAVCLVFFLGLPLIIKFAAFFTNLGGSDKPVDSNDITPPAPPQFETYDEYTNKDVVKIEGRSEEGALITLSFNGKETETVANSDGKFSFEVSLNDGENNFYAVAKDTSGNMSQETQINYITFDNKEPELSVDSPSDGDSFYGSGQRQINVKGSVDADSEVYINDRYVTVSDDGSFSYTTTLSEGINEFNIKAVDKAKNEISTTLSVNFTP